MAVLLNAIVCYFVTPAHSCCVLRAAYYYNIALVYLRSPSALLLCCTALALRHFAALTINKKKKRGVPFRMEALFARG